MLIYMESATCAYILSLVEFLSPGQRITTFYQPRKCPEVILIIILLNYALDNSYLLTKGEHFSLCQLIVYRIYLVKRRTFNSRRT